MFILPSDMIFGGAVQKYENNVSALRILKALRSEGRRPTDSECAILAHYTGWGDAAVLKMARAMSNASSWAYVTDKPNEDLAPLVTADEWASILASSINAHYTSLPVIHAIWEGVARVLPTSGPLRVLEPSCGVGHFLGCAPESLRERMTRPTMVELDPITAGIASVLYPEAEVVCSGFENTFRERSGRRTLVDHFDLAISNVPFGKVQVADPGMSARSVKSSIHNYFITRMLELVRPGGYVVAITSRFSLDGTTTGPICRDIWSKVAALELAVRLPCDAFKANAGTEVVTDVLFLRKLRSGETGNADEWVSSELRDVPGTAKREGYRYADGVRWEYNTPRRPNEQPLWCKWEEPTFEQIQVSKWYHSHPDHILGREYLSGSMYANRSSYGDKSKDGELIDLKPFPEGYGRSKKEREERDRVKSVHMKVGSYNVESDNSISLPDRMVSAFQSLTRREDSAPAMRVAVSVALPEKVGYVPQTPTQSLWFAVYSQAKEVIRLQVERCSDDDLDAAQAGLRRLYALCARKVTHKEVSSAFKDRPDIYSFLLALEKPDGSPEAIFSRRTIFPESLSVSSANPTDALFRCLDLFGALDLEWIATSCAQSKEQVIESLGEQIYLDPEADRWVVAADYLSGNVRRKLQRASSESRFRPELVRNVKALEKVQPPELTPGDVFVSLKSTWIPLPIMTDWLKTFAKSWSTPKVSMSVGFWVLNHLDTRNMDDEDTDKYSTNRASVSWLIQCGMDGQAPTIYDEVAGDAPGTTRRVKNLEASVLAQAKLDEIQKAFVQWLWSDSERTKELLDAYSDKHNCFRVREWDGSFLTFPGMSTELELKPFQKDGVARAIFADRKNHPAFIWPTGAGKTFGGIASIEKLLQLGMIHKACICVPKHLVNQWVDEYRRLFPGRSDQILCAGKDDLTKQARGVFLSRAATSGYKVVILSHTQYKAIPVKDETFKTVVDEQLQQLEDAIADQEAQDDDTRTNKTLKQLQAMKANLKARLTQREQETTRDSSWTITFEELGFDMFLGDEAQAWKNLQLVTRMGNVNGIRTGASQISLDFLVKARYLQYKCNARLLLATATPVANSLAETFVFASYLQHETLKEHGIDTPDAFFGAFTRTYSSTELEPSCATYRVVTRLEFGNIPELVYLLRQSWHSIPVAKLGLKLPEMVSGQEIVVQTPASKALREYIDDIAERVKVIRSGGVEPRIDNMLKVCSDGRWASLVNGPPDGTIRDTKLDRVIDQIFTHYQETMDDLGTQVVFCDLGTPTGESDKAVAVSDDDTTASSDSELVTAEAQVEQSRVYEYIRAGLVKRGINLSEIEFLQDHQGDPKKLRALYQNINDGVVRVLIGSAPTGMNIQKRLVALHHVDPVWRPDWKTQRDGRILRQGNMWSQVYVYIYLTEGSFDAYMWGLIRAKLRVIEQVTTGDPTVRKIDGDVGDIVLRASEIQAIASGNPLVLTFVGVQNDLTRLSALRNEWERNQSNMRWLLNSAPGDLTRMRAQIAAHTKTLQVYKAAVEAEAEAAETDAGDDEAGGSKKKFTCTIARRTYTTRKDATAAAVTEARRQAMSASNGSATIGRWRGLSLFTRWWGDSVYLGLTLPDGPDGLVITQYDSQLNKMVWHNLDSEIMRIPSNIRYLEGRIADMEQKVRDYTRLVGRPWHMGEEYWRLYQRYETLQVELAGAGVSGGEFQKPLAAWAPVSVEAESLAVEVEAVVEPETQSDAQVKAKWVQMSLF